MSRPGITYQEVANTAAQIQGLNENPTVDRVRAILNTGSKTTIARYLKEWKTKTDHIAGTETIPQELIALIKGLWERLNAEANQKITQHQHESDYIIHEIKKELTQTQAFNADLKTKNYQLEENLHQEKQLSADLHQSLEDEKRLNAKLAERNDRLTQQLSDQKSETDRLHQLLSHVQANLEHYQTAIQKLRDEQVLADEKQKASFNHEISGLKKELVENTHQKIQLQRHLDQIEHEFKLVNQQQDKISEENASLQKQLQEKVISESILKQQCQQLDKACNRYQEKNEDQSKIVIDSNYVRTIDPLLYLTTKPL